jgi:hypothetical protein
MGEHFEKFSKEQQVKRNRLIALILAGMLVFSLATLVYAYTQNMDAKRQRELSVHLKEELVRMEKIAEQNQKEAMRQRVLAEESERMAQKALEECKQNQKSK